MMRVTAPKGGDREFGRTQKMGVLGTIFVRSKIERARLESALRNEHAAAMSAFGRN